MLVLSRKESETILIGNDIKITVIRTGHSVKIGIDAPKGVVVLRGELANAVTTTDPCPDLEPATKRGRSSADLDSFITAMRHS